MWIWSYKRIKSYPANGYSIRRDNYGRDKARQNIWCKLIRMFRRISSSTSATKSTPAGVLSASAFSPSLSVCAERQRINLRRDLRACEHAHACITHGPTVSHAHESLYVAQGCSSSGSLLCRVPRVSRRHAYTRRVALWSHHVTHNNPDADVWGSPRTMQFRFMASYPADMIVTSNLHESSKEAWINYWVITSFSSGSKIAGYLTIRIKNMHFIKKVNK